MHWASITASALFPEAVGPTSAIGSKFTLLVWPTKVWVMAEARISLKRFTTLDFPSVCAVTGLPAAEIFAFTFDGVKGGLPLNQSSARVVKQQQATLRFLAAATVVLFVLAAALKSIVIGAGTAGTAAIVLANFASVRSRLPRGRIQDKQVTLTNVHPDFVSALSDHKCQGCPAVGSCEVSGAEPVASSAH